MLQVVTVWGTIKQLFFFAFLLSLAAALVSAFVFGVYMVLTSFSLVALMLMIVAAMALTGFAVEIHRFVARL
jgi:hypothetical protein